VFRGPADSNSKASSLFKIPIEAKAIRIYPLTWHKSIAIRTELLGCATKVPSTVKQGLVGTTPKPIVKPGVTVIPGVTVKPSVTAKPSSTIKPVFPEFEEDVIPMCDDPMGVENGQLAPSQIKVSSSKLPVPGVKTAAVPLKPSEALKMTSKQGWQPMMDSPNEFVVVSS
jgi:von Willebrand factor